ncbi:MAG: hypothetical protein QOI36_6580 [Pseudonocardiales bacterium]|jgi:hypothetical protein|nr:hypothetical protein [Pseudonocardiales bacterium]MDX6294956.1 hypothetical protein [Kribbellaceae bacterium]
MQEVVRRCDYLIGTKGNPCGERLPEDKPTPFTYDLVEYEADLCEKHRVDYAKAMTPFVTIARPVRTRAGTAVRKAMKGKKGAFTTKDVREWLQAQGRDVAPSGRLPEAVLKEYERAQKS